MPLGIVASRFVHSIDCGADIAPCANELFRYFAGPLLIPGHLFTARAGDAQRNATAEISVAGKLLRMRSKRPPSTLRCLVVVLSRCGANLRGRPHPARSALVLVHHGVRRSQAGHQYERARASVDEAKAQFLSNWQRCRAVFTSVIRRSRRMSGLRVRAMTGLMHGSKQNLQARWSSAVSITVTSGEFLPPGNRSTVGTSHSRKLKWASTANPVRLTCSFMTPSRKICGFSPPQGQRDKKQRNKETKKQRNKDSRRNKRPANSEAKGVIPVVSGEREAERRPEGLGREKPVTAADDTSLAVAAFDPG
jgi:hypothetical protein